MMKIVPEFIPAGFDLETMLINYKYVFENNSAVVLDTNAFNPHIWFGYYSKKSSEACLARLAQDIDFKHSVYPLEDFLKKVSILYGGLMGLIISNNNKTHVLPNIRNECANKIEAYRNFMKHFLKTGYLKDCRRKNQRSIINLYNHIAYMIEEILEIVPFYEFNPAPFRLNVDKELVHYSYSLLKKLDSVTIISSDYGISRILEKETKITPIMSTKKLSVVGIRLIRSMNFINLRKFWESGNKKQKEYRDDLLR